VRARNPSGGHSPRPEGTTVSRFDRTLDQWSPSLGGVAHCPERCRGHLGAIPSARFVFFRAAASHRSIEEAARWSSLRDAGALREHHDGPGASVADDRRRPIRQRLLKPRVRVRSEPPKLRAANRRSSSTRRCLVIGSRWVRIHGVSPGKMCRSPSILVEPGLPVRGPIPRSGDEMASPLSEGNRALASATRFTWRLLTPAANSCRYDPRGSGV
jgi:hypothetical protein